MGSSEAGVILLGADDNCVVAARALAAGETVHLDGAPLYVAQAVGLGHKLARRAIAPGQKVLKYGAPIGHAIAPIQRGEHIHLHNLASDWIPTWQPG
jgi:altronate dehydratase small subunit